MDPTEPMHPGGQTRPRKFRGGMIMGDKGSKDKGNKEKKKKPQHSQKEKKQLKREKKNK